MAWLFTGILSTVLAVLGYRLSRRVDQRGLILAAMIALISIDIWAVLTPRLQTAVTTGGKFASVVIVKMFGGQFGSYDIAFAIAIIAVMAALGGVIFAVYAGAAQVLAFAVGTFIVGMTMPLPGSLFIILFAAPFLWFTRDKWTEISAGDKAFLRAVCGGAAILVIAGIAMTTYMRS